MTELNLLRKKIDKVDEQLIQLLKERIEISKKIGEIKKKNNIAIYDKNRENEIISKFIDCENEANKKYIENFLKNIFAISKEVQNK